MTKTINIQNIQAKSLFYLGIITLSLLVLLGNITVASAAIDRQLDLGSTGSDVTELQTYLARTASIYPSGLITGYFGQLTKAAVERFQTTYGIVSSGTPSTTGYGRVGPMTMAKINALLNSSSPIQTFWDTGPILSNTSIQTDRNSAKISWTTNEQTQGQVYYNNTPLSLSEANGPRQQPYVSGTLTSDGSALQNYHSITISNLQSDTVYYYLTRAVDNVGNMNMTWPSSFRTEK